MSLRCRLTDHDWRPGAGGDLECRRCGARFKQDDSGEWRAVLRPSKRDYTWHTVAGVVLIIGAVALVAEPASRSPVIAEWRADEQGRQEQRLAREAHEQCQQAVLARLVAPATAQFASRSDAVVRREPGSQTYGTNGRRITGERHIVSAYVDAQNSFGALIRQRYVCTVAPRGDSWRLLSLDISPPGG